MNWILSGDEVHCLVLERNKEQGQDKRVELKSRNSLRGSERMGSIEQDLNSVYYLLSK